MGRLIIFLLILVFIGFAALSAYSYLADQQPLQNQVTKPVLLNAN